MTTIDFLTKIHKDVQIAYKTINEEVHGAIYNKRFDVFSNFDFWLISRRTSEYERLRNCIAVMLTQNHRRMETLTTAYSQLDEYVTTRIKVLLESTGDAANIAGNCYAAHHLEVIFSSIGRVYDDFISELRAQLQQEAEIIAFENNNCL